MAIYITTAIIAINPNWIMFYSIINISLSLYGESSFVNPLCYVFRSGDFEEDPESNQEIVADFSGIVQIPTGSIPE